VQVTLIIRFTDAKNDFPTVGELILTKIGMRPIFSNKYNNYQLQ
jgi:hypothetical protein